MLTKNLNVNICNDLINQFIPYDCFIDNKSLTKIRVGNKSDGGYVIYKELFNKVTKVFSFGIGDDISFEIELSKKFSNIHKINLFDPTINLINVPDKKLFTFKKETLLKEDTSLFFEKENTNNSLLKMDVEGDEWDYLYELGYEVSFNNIIVEFHLFNILDRKDLSPYFTEVYNKKFIKEINDSIYERYLRVLSILNEEYYLYHIHVNNSLLLVKDIPQLIECSFVRKDLIHKVEKTKTIFPIQELDYPNKVDRSDVVFDELNRRL